MGSETSLSEQELAVEARRGEIEKLRDHAVETPEARDEAIRSLKQYEQAQTSQTRAAAAGRAIATILAVSMLETLQGD